MKLCDYLTEWREWSDDLAGGEKRTVMTIRDLEPQTRYSITLYAVNAVGEGRPVELSYTTKARSKFIMVSDDLGIIFRISKKKKHAISCGLALVRITSLHIKYVMDTVMILSFRTLKKFVVITQNLNYVALP